MSADYDFLPQILERVTRQPALGAVPATDLLAVTDSVGTGVSARAMVAALGTATLIAPDVVMMAESNLFELDAAGQSSGTDSWNVSSPSSTDGESAYVSAWENLGFGVGDILVFPEQMCVAEVTSMNELAVGGQSYAAVGLSGDPQIGVAASEVSVASQRAGVSPMTNEAVSLRGNGLVLDGVYPGIKGGDIIVIEYDGERVLGTVKNAVAVQYEMSFELVGDGTPNPAFVPATKIYLADSPLDGSWDQAYNYTIHYNLVPAGRIFPAPAETIDHTAFETGSPVTGTAPGPQGKYAIVDTNGRAGIFEGAVLQNGTELNFHATRFLQGEANYKLPAKLYGPLLEATRGQTVAKEILGSGNVAIAFQSFTLKKSPLTYLADASAPNGRRPVLTVSVNGKKWRQVQSFYGASSSDEIYLVTHDAAGKTTITFGDGELGARVPTGLDNVVASYRHGVGGNVDANAINAFKKPVKGIRKVFNPLPASGGEDLPSAAQAREKAIQSTRVLGRLVSLLDFEVEAARFGGVMQARAGWVWDDSGEDAAVHAWIVTAGTDDPSEALRSYLLGLAEPDAQVVVQRAQPMIGAFELDLEIDPLYEPDAVSRAVLEHLFDPFAGMLSLRKIAIGGHFHRSRLYAAIHEVEGVLGVNEVMINNMSMSPALELAEGQYIDLVGEPIAINGVLYSADVDGKVSKLPSNTTLPIPLSSSVVWIRGAWESVTTSAQQRLGKAPLPPIPPTRNFATTGRPD